MQDGQVIRQTVMRRLTLAMAMATAGELQRAAEFLEFARDIRHGKRQQRSGWRGRKANAPQG